MPNRILKESICASPNLDRVTAEQENLFYRLIVNCDDYGRADARPSVLRSNCYPLRIDKLNNETIVNNIVALAKEGLLQVYESENRFCLQMVTWPKHQQIRAKKSKYPEPNGTGFINIDNICNQLLSNVIGNQLQSIDNKCHRNPIQSNPIENPIQSSSPQPLPSEMAFKLADKLVNLILSNNPKGKTPQDITGWAKEIDRMIKIDKRTEIEIASVIEFSQQDNFWKTNILSAGKLREKFDQLYLKSKNEKRPFLSKKEKEIPTSEELIRDWPNAIR